MAGICSVSLTGVYLSNTLGLVILSSEIREFHWLPKRIFVASSLLPPTPLFIQPPFIPPEVWEEMKQVKPKLLLSISAQLWVNPLPLCQGSVSTLLRSFVARFQPDIPAGTMMVKLTFLPLSPSVSVLGRGKACIT